MRHTLSLHIPEQYNPELMIIKDTSVYAVSPAVSCERLEIIRPGTTIPVYIDLDKNFEARLSSAELEYTDPTSENSALPDGVYTVRYSVSPNDKVFVDYVHLRTVNIENQYYTELGKVELHGFEPASDIKAKLAEFRLLRMYIRTAKAKVEFHHDIEDGVAILNYVKKILDRMSKQKSC